MIREKWGDIACPRCGFLVYQDEAFCLNCEIVVNPVKIPEEMSETMSWNAFVYEKAVEKWWGILNQSCESYYFALVFFGYCYTGFMFDPAIGNLWNSCVNLPLAIIFWLITSITKPMKNQPLALQQKKRLSVMGVSVGLSVSIVLLILMPKSIIAFYRKHFESRILMSEGDMLTFWIWSFVIATALLSLLYVSRIWVGDRFTIRDRLDHHQFPRELGERRPFSWNRWLVFEIYIPLLFWFVLFIVVISIR